ncbi:hypothetical protein N2152v2_002055 [Parachlorella kessleri]
MADKTASEYLQEQGLSEMTTHIIVSRLKSTGYVTDNTVAVSDLHKFATHLQVLDTAGRRAALEALLPQNDFRPLLLPKLTLAVNGLLKDQDATKQQVLAKVEELLDGIKELLQTLQVS